MNRQKNLCILLIKIKRTGMYNGDVLIKLDWIIHSCEK